MSTSSPVIKGIFFRLFLKSIEPSITQLVKPESGNTSDALGLSPHAGNIIAELLFVAIFDVVEK